MKILLTGFEPFAGRDINPSQLVVAALSSRQLPGIELVTAVLPVDRQKGPATLLGEVREKGPDAVLCLGLAGRRPAVSIERVFVNLMDYGLPDNAGQRITDEPIATDGPAAYFATLPVRAMLRAIANAGIPVTLSLSAGAFLCNQVSYALCHHLAGQQSPVPAGFMHLPYLPQQVASDTRPQPSMSLETMVMATTIALQTIVNR